MIVLIIFGILLLLAIGLIAYIMIRRRYSKTIDFNKSINDNDRIVPA